jgi:hypothetical protein
MTMASTERPTAMVSGEIGAGESEQAARHAADRAGDRERDQCTRLTLMPIASGAQRAVAAARMA